MLDVRAEIRIALGLMVDSHYLKEFRNEKTRKVLERKLEIRSSEIIQLLLLHFEYVRHSMFAKNIAERYP